MQYKFSKSRKKCQIIFIKQDIKSTILRFLPNLRFSSKLLVSSQPKKSELDIVNIIGSNKLSDRRKNIFKEILNRKYPSVKI